MVIADEQAQPAFVAADLLSQAEHGADSQVMLVCPSRQKAEAVVAEVERQRALLPRADFAAKALENSRAVILDKLDDIVAFADTYAPEHLIVNTREPWTIADRVRAAGSVFVGAWTPESAGDYASGTNHTLPDHHGDGRCRRSRRPCARGDHPPGSSRGTAFRFVHGSEGICSLTGGLFPGRFPFGWFRGGTGGDTAGGEPRAGEHRPVGPLFHRA